MPPRHLPFDARAPTRFWNAPKPGKSAPAQAPREAMPLADSLPLASMSPVSTTVRPTPLPPKPPAPPPRVPHDPTRHPFTTPRFRTGPQPLRRCKHDTARTPATSGSSPFRLRSFRNGFNPPTDSVEDPFLFLSVRRHRVRYASAMHHVSCSCSVAALSCDHGKNTGRGRAFPGLRAAK